MTETTLPGGTFPLADGLTVTRMGYGAMQLAGPLVLGPPADRDAAVAVLRAAIELGVTHIDTSDFYGPHVTNEIVREALHPYPDELTIVTKVGVTRDAEGGRPVALAAHRTSCSSRAPPSLTCARTSSGRRSPCPRTTWRC